MTTNEIKTLIQNTIAGQGSQVDIGGKLAEILGAIVDAIPSVEPSGETPRPILMTDYPSVDDTIESLAAKGLTLSELSAAALGYRTGISIDGKFFLPFMGGYYMSANNFNLSFGQVGFDTDGQVVYLAQYTMQIIDGVFSVTEATM